MKTFGCLITALALWMVLCTGVRAEPGEGWTVGRVRVEGLETVSKKQVRQALSVRQASIRPWVRPQVYDPANVEADLKSIRKLLQQEGFFSPQVEHSLKERPRRKRVDVSYHIVEGEPVVIQSIKVEGLAGLDPALAGPVRGLLTIKEGERLQTKPYGRAKDEMVTLLQNSGYPHAKVAGAIQVDKDAGASGILITVTPGDLAVFGPVRVAGLEKTDPAVLLSRLAFEPGQIYSRKALEASQREMFTLGFLAAVGLTPDSETDSIPGEIPLKIDGEYKKFKSLRFGLGYGSEDQVRVQAGWRHRHLTSKARRFDFSLKYSDIVQSAEASLYQPHFFSPRQEAADSMGVKRRDEVSHVTVSVFNDFSVSRKLSDIWTIHGGHLLELHRVQELTAVLEENGTDVDEDYLLSSLTLGCARDTRPDEPNPRTGTLFSSQAWWGGSGIGSEIDYYKVDLEGRLLLPLGGWAVLASRLHAAGMEPTGGTKSIPLFMRLFSGGSHSVRGYSYQKLGPRDAYGDPVGGQTLAEASVELRLSIYKKFWGVVFLDAGALMKDSFSFDSDELRYSAGPGLRYQSPVGPLSLDVGWQLNPQDKEDDVYCIHFSVGHAY